jgi:hypothetical protein
LKEKFIPQGIMGIVLNFMQLEDKLKLKRGGVMKNKCESKIKIYGKRKILNKNKNKEKLKVIIIS